MLTDVAHPVPCFTILRLADHNEGIQSNESDLDSALGSPTSSYSASLASSVLNYKYENGRRYHAFRAGEYPLPNDEREQDRLDLLHHIFRLILDGALFRAPLPPHPQRAERLAVITACRESASAVNSIH